MLLVGDIGGTYARLALVDAGSRSGAPVGGRDFPSRDYASVEEVVREYLATSGASVERAVIAVAGPVVEGRVEFTNLGWTVDEAVLRATLGIPEVLLVNDLVALASAIPFLGPDECVTLQAGEPVAGGALAVVAPGTGLGEAFLVPEGDGYRACPSEAGHADFAPRDALQAELLAWLSAREPHVSYERACSGRALPDLYDFLRSRYPDAETPEMARILATAEDRSVAIVERAMDPAVDEPLCTAVIELFASVLAAEASNAALRVLATGGVYLGGGLPRRILPVLQRPAFLARFRAKGRLSPLIERIPLLVVTSPHAALLGSAHLATRAAGAGR